MEDTPIRPSGVNEPTPSNTPPEAEKPVLGLRKQEEEGAGRPTRTYHVGTVWNHDDFRHEVVERTRNVALVRKNLIGGKWQGWEVAVIRRQPAREIEGRAYAEGEKYPANEQWGQYGWSYTTEEDARKKVGALLAL